MDGIQVAEVSGVSIEPSIESSSETPSTSDPKVFFDEYTKSPEYQEAYASFFKDKDISPTVSDEAKTNAFNDSENVASAMVDFYEEKLRLSYSSDQYSKEVIDAIDLYFNTIRNIKKSAKWERDELQTLDIMRSMFHTKAAEQLVKDGMVPSEKIGRQMMRLLSVSSGLEELGTAKIPDAERNRRGYGATR